MPSGNLTGLLKSPDRTHQRVPRWDCKMISLWQEAIEFLKAAGNNSQAFRQRRILAQVLLKRILQQSFHSLIHLILPRLQTDSSTTSWGSSYIT